MDVTHLDSAELAENWLASRPDERMRSGYPLHAGLGSPCAVVTMLLDPGGAVPAHEHDVPEVILVLDGVVEAWVGDERQEAGPHALVVVPAGAPHGLRNTGEGRARAVGFFPSGSVVTRFAETVEPDGKAVLGTPDLDL